MRDAPTYRHVATRSLKALCVLLAAGVMMGLVLTTSASAADVVLGSPSYVPNGNGFGTSQPASIFNGGVPSGLVNHIVWRRWGTPTATGVGLTALYKPQGGYFATPGKVALRAQTIGQCPGQTVAAYTVLLVRVPPWPGGPLGPWFKWSGSRTICDYSDTDPRYVYRKRPGECGDLGKDYVPGELFDIRAYRASCTLARRVAARSRRRLRSCARNECTTRDSGFRCRWQAIHPQETSPSLAAAYPVQRVSCKRGHVTLSWWRVVGAE